MAWYFKPDSTTEALAAGGTGPASAAPARTAWEKEMGGLIRPAVPLLLLLLPLIVYSPAIFHYYGMRDSYSNLREAHEEPGKLVRFCASHARPIYGWLLEVTLRRIDSIRQLEWIRLLSTILLGLVSLVTYRLLRALGWTIGASLLLALWLGLLPTAQVIAGWAIGWPYGVAVLAALVAFYLSEKSLAGAGAVPGRVASLGLAVGLLAISALVYQPNALFYLVPLAAGLLVRRNRHSRDDVRWVALHLLVVSISLGLAYGFMQLCYRAGIFQKSARIAFETHWGEKLEWFLREPLQNAMSLLVINDDHRHDHAAYLAGVVIFGGVLLLGAGWEWRRYGQSRGLVWLAGLVGLPVFAFGISLLAAERYATYRTIFGLTGVLLCYLLISLQAILHRMAPVVRRVCGGLTLLAAALVAQHRAYALLAVPQGKEWALMLEGAEQVKLTTPTPTVFAIEPTPDDVSTTTIYHDEFGSLSSNSDWVPKEMFKRAMHDLHPDIPDLSGRYRFASGRQIPLGRRFDVVIDLRRLRAMRTPD